MRLFFRMASAWKNLFARQRAEAELDEELRAWVEMTASERTAAGMSAAEARRTALADFGGVEQVKQRVRDHRSGAGLELLGQDLRYGLRQLRRNRAFTLTAVITLGLGIGATAAIFSAVYSLLLRPLPYPGASRLVWIANVWPKIHTSNVMSPDLIAARSGTRSFDRLLAYFTQDSNLTGAGDALRVTRAQVTANFLAVLGATPQLGRGITVADDKPGGANVVLISDRLWRNRFHADSAIVGKSITLDGTAQTVIGVLPARFQFPDLSIEPDVYAPLGLDPDASVTLDKRVLLLSVIAQLRPGATVQQAQAEMITFFDARMHAYPVPYARMAEGHETRVETLQRHIAGDDRTPLLILLAAVGAVLLIACANVANLQLARAVSRRHEIAVRGALGASRKRLIRQFLIESLLVSACAVALGLLIAFIVTQAVRHVPIEAGPETTLFARAAEMLRLPFGKLSAAIGIDAWVMAFTVGLGVATTVLFGLAPAIGGSRADLRSALQSAASRMTSGRDQRWLRHTLLVAEVGLAVVLLASAGLVVRSFVNVLRFDSGFDPGNTLTGITLLNPARYADGDRIRGFVDQLVSRMNALPGVTAAAATTVLPLQPDYMGNSIAFDGIPVAPGGLRPSVPLPRITPDYFRAVGTPILRGRGFTAADNATAPLVAIVTRAFASRFFPGDDAIGKRFHTMARGQDSAPITIVGICDDVRHNGLESEVRPEAFLPMAQAPSPEISLAVRTSGNPAMLANALREAVAAVDPQQPLFDVETMDRRVANAVAQRRLTMLLISSFAALAMVLSAVGVYGVFAYSVAQRTQEMGIRLALGATRRGLLRLVVSQAARLILLGGVAGLAAAFALSRLLTSVLVGVKPHDAWSFTAAWVLMTAVALAASIVPAAQAARTDVTGVLRNE